MNNAAYLVEVRRQSKIGVSVEKEISEKIKRLPLRGRKSVRLALVYYGELDPAVAERGYFDALVPIEDILAWRQ